MTVKELIEKLQKINNKNLPVYILMEGENGVDIRDNFYINISDNDHWSKSGIKRGVNFEC